MKKLLIIVIVAGMAVAILLFKNKSAVAPEDSDQTVCTKDAKQCPDGSYVGRQGPKCEFAACPSVRPGASVNDIPSPTPTATVKNQTATIVFIKLVNEVATPSVVNIKVGDTVKFINNSSALHWPASGVHPTHQICPGFDSLRGLKTGESYSFTFNIAKTCPWHDHLQPSINGQIVVSP